MKTKNGVAIKLTDKNRKKVGAILEMFKEELCSTSTLEEEYVAFDNRDGTWTGGTTYCSWIHGKTLVTPKELKQILAAEKLKTGDYIIAKTRGSSEHYLVKFTRFGEGRIFGCYTYKSGIDGKYVEVSGESLGFSNFKRYATPEEIAQMEGVREPEPRRKDSLQVGKWYNYAWASDPDEILGIFFVEKIDDYKVWVTYGISFLDGWLNRDWYSSAHKWTEATPEQVETALIEEANKRGFINGVYIKSPWLNGVKSALTIGSNYSYYNNELTVSGGIGRYTIFKDGIWATVIEQPIDKFAELKEAHKNGAVIQYKNNDGKWIDINHPEPSWSRDEYRIKPEEKPKLVDSDIGVIERLHDALLETYDWRLESDCLVQARKLCTKLHEIIKNNK